MGYLVLIEHQGDEWRSSVYERGSVRKALVAEATGDWELTRAIVDQAPSLLLVGGIASLMELFDAHGCVELPRERVDASG